MKEMSEVLRIESNLREINALYKANRYDDV